MNCKERMGESWVNDQRRVSGSVRSKVINGRRLALVRVFTERGGGLVTAVNNVRYHPE